MGFKTNSNSRSEWNKFSVRLTADVPGTKHFSGAVFGLELEELMFGVLAQVTSATAFDSTALFSNQKPVSGGVSLKAWPEIGSMPLCER